MRVVIERCHKQPAQACDRPPVCHRRSRQCGSSPLSSPWPSIACFKHLIHGIQTIPNSIRELNSAKAKGRSMNHLLKERETHFIVACPCVVKKRKGLHLKNGLQPCRISVGFLIPKSQARPVNPSTIRHCVILINMEGLAGPKQVCGAILLLNFKA